MRGRDSRKQLDNFAIPRGSAARSPAAVESETVLLPLENILSNDISWKVGKFTSICSTREICERSGPIFC